MKCTRLWILLCTLVPLILLAAQGQVSATATTTPGLGTSVEKGGYSFAVTAFNASPIAASWYEAEPGKRLVAVEVVIGNVSGETISSNSLCATLIDGDGFAYVEGGDLDSGELQLVDLGPGERIKSWMSFVIPENATPVRMKYERHSDLVGQVAVRPVLESEARAPKPSEPDSAPPTQTPTQPVSATCQDSVGHYLQEVQPLLTEFSDTVQGAAATSRIALGPVVQNLQMTRWKMEAVPISL